MIVLYNDPRLEPFDGRGDNTTHSCKSSGRSCVSPRLGREVRYRSLNPFTLLFRGILTFLRDTGLPNRLVSIGAFLDWDLHVDGFRHLAVTIPGLREIFSFPVVPVVSIVVVTVTTIAMLFAFAEPMVFGHVQPSKDFGPVFHGGGPRTTRLLLMVSSIHTPLETWEANA